MAVVDTLRSIWIGVNVQAKDDRRHLTPVSTFLGGIEQAQIGREMCFVVSIHPLGQRRAVLEGGLVFIDVFPSFGDFASNRSSASPATGLR